jgi:hypothetical protein
MRTIVIAIALILFLVGCNAQKAADITTDSNMTGNDIVKYEGDFTYSKEANFSECFSKEYMNKPEEVRQYCINTFNLSRCKYEETESSRNYCFMETAAARKDIAICDNIKIDGDKYLCYGGVAEQLQDPNICYLIPVKMSSYDTGYGALDIKYECFKKIKFLDPRYNESLRYGYENIFGLEQNTNMIARICKDGIDEYSHDHLFKGSILRCGDYYEVRPDPNLMDAPDLIIDKEGLVVAYCGGMPLPGESQPNEKCQISCEEKDLCKGVVLDCSLYKISNQIPKDYVKQVQYYQIKMIDDYSGCDEACKKEYYASCQELNRNR